MQQALDQLKPNTPVIVGLGFIQEKNDDPQQCHEAIKLMETAIRNAAGDATGNAADCATLLQQLDSISVQQGTWKYANPGKLLADSLGCPAATSVLADLGVLQLTSLFNLCQAISAGEQQLGVVTGGEARYRELRGMITNQKIVDTEQPEGTPPPDVVHETPDSFVSDLEAKIGIWSPGELFAIADSAVRHHQGSSIDDWRDKLAKLYSEFSEIAASNPHAWKQQPMSAAEIRTPSDKNSMMAFPYTKRLMSQWNVNQAVAIIVCSAEKAQSLGLQSDGWIYPVAAVQSRHVVMLSQKSQLHSHPGAVLTGQRALALADVATSDLVAADLYSCFPSAVLSFAADLQLDEHCSRSVTGSMAFAGGPYNHSALDGIARMAEVLRPMKENGTAERHSGLVTNISGMFGKQACAILSTVPHSDGYKFEDVTERVAENDLPVPLNGDYEGPARIVGYTVVYNKGELSHSVAFCDTSDGKRTVVKTEDKALAQRMTEEEFVGRTVNVQRDGVFAADGF